MTNNTETSPQPPPKRAPFMARLTSPAGPALPRIVTSHGATVVAVPGLYCVTYLLLAPGAVTVVDIGSRSDHEGILAMLGWLGRPVQQVKAIVPTHMHMDHIIGVDAFAGRFDLAVSLGDVAHAAVTRGRKLRFPRGLHVLRALPTFVMQGAPRAPLADWERGLGFGFPWSKNHFVARLTPPLEHGQPLPGMPGWRVLHTPGHADDAICLHHEAARFLVAGDTVRNFLGGEWNPLACDKDRYSRSQELLHTLDVETIFPGHGPILSGQRIVSRLRTLPRFMP